MAVQNNLDNKKLRHKTLRKKAAKFALPAIFASVIGGAAYHINHEYLDASDRFLEAAHAGNTQEMDLYGSRLTNENKIRQLYVQGIQENNKTMIYELLHADDGPYDDTFQSFMGKSRINEEVVEKYGVELANYAISLGHYDLVSLFVEPDSNDRLELILRFAAFKMNDVALDLFFEHSDGVYSPLFGHLKADKLAAYIAKNTDWLSLSIVPFLDELFANGDRVSNTDSFRASLLSIYEDLGALDHAVKIVKQQDDSDKYKDIVSRMIVRSGDLDQMIDFALNWPILSDRELVNFAAKVLFTGKSDVAEDFISHFNLNDREYITTALLMSTVYKDESLNQYLVDYGLKTLGPDGVVGVLGYYRGTSNEADEYWLGLAKLAGTKMNADHREKLASQFRGAMDDHLRLYWEGLDLNDESAPAPAPSNIFDLSRENPFVGVGHPPIPYNLPAARP